MSRSTTADREPRQVDAECRSGGSGKPRSRLLARRVARGTLAAGLMLLVQPLLTERSAATLAGDPIAARVVWETTPLDWPAGYNVLIPAGTAAVVNLGVQTPEYSVPFFGLGGSRFKIDFFTGPSIGGSTNALSIHVDFADLGVWPIPSTFQVSLSDLDWGGTPPGRITGIVKVSGQPSVLEVIGFTDDSITLGMGSRVVIGGTGFDVEYRYTGTEGGATTLGPFSVADVFLTPPCWSGGGCTPANFPQNWGTVRTFTYTIPAGQSVLDARIKGTWGGHSSTALRRSGSTSRESWWPSASPHSRVGMRL